MSGRAAITVQRSREEVERLWQDPGYRPQFTGSSGASVRFGEAPGDRGTEIHVDVASGGVGDTLQKLKGAAPLAKVKDQLRHFKQQVETGVITRSEAVPEGEQVRRKFKTRPAQPLPQSELDKAGVR